MQGVSDDSARKSGATGELNLDDVRALCATAIAARDAFRANDPNAHVLKLHERQAFLAVRVLEQIGKKP